MTTTEAAVAETTTDVALPPPPTVADEAAADTAANAVTSDAAVESPEVPIHQGKCGEPGCGVGATWRPMASGNGFMVLERIGVDIEHAFGAGPNGRPLCPKGHGELTIADDLLPASDAITKVAEQVEAAKAPRLPFPAPPFNFEGAFEAIKEKRHEVKQLERAFEQADDRRKKAKTALDDANEELGKMIDDFEERAQERQFEIERRQGQAEGGHPDGTTLVHCAYEQQHPGQTCPLCDGSATDVDIPARDTAAHVDRARAVIDTRAVNQLLDELDNVANIVVAPGVVIGWSVEERDAVSRWVTAIAEHDDTAPLPERPAVLGTSHVAGACADGQDQCCTQCDAVLIIGSSTEGGDDPNYYATGTLVGTDCPGKPKKAKGPDHHYPKRHGDKKKSPAKSRKQK